MTTHLTFSVKMVAQAWLNCLAAVTSTDRTTSTWSLWRDRTTSTLFSSSKPRVVLSSAPWRAPTAIRPESLIPDAVGPDELVSGYAPAFKLKEWRKARVHRPGQVRRYKPRMKPSMASPQERSAACRVHVNIIPNSQVAKAACSQARSTFGRKLNRAKSRN